MGESLRQQQQQEAEEEKCRAILCTEDVIRREESHKQEEQLTQARDEWKKERQQLFQEAHHNQLRAIARQTTILENTLRKEFADTQMKIEEEHRAQIDMIVQRTWVEAGVIKEKAIDDTRLEEQERASKEARKVARIVDEEKVLAAEMAACDKAHALDEQRQQMEKLRIKALDDQCRQLETEFEARLNEVCRINTDKLAKCEQRYSEQKSTAERLEKELIEMKELKEDWKEKYQNLKVEFSDFIDQFPGFKGEFLLK